MPRLASLYLPDLAIERIRRAARRPSPPEAGPARRGELPVLDDLPPGNRLADCSCPRGGGWRPGARWAREKEAEDFQPRAGGGGALGAKPIRQRVSALDGEASGSPPLLRQ